MRSTAGGVDGGFAGSAGSTVRVKDSRGDFPDAAGAATTVTPATMTNDASSHRRARRETCIIDAPSLRSSTRSRAVRRDSQHVDTQRG